MPAFITGIELSRLFYREAVRPVLDGAFPGLRHAAALIGVGSEVLGYDTEVSSDHAWGPRLLLFLSEDDVAERGAAVHEALRFGLPHAFHGYSTHFAEPEPDDPGTRMLVDATEGPVEHAVQITSWRGYVRDYLGFDPVENPSVADWLTFPEQKLLALTSGAVYHDDLGLEAARARFADHPRDVWLYLLASAWARIGQEEHLMGRAGQVGDDLGSAILGARLARDVMRLGFLMERRYAPYPKWFGTAFARLECATALTPHLEGILRSAEWRARQNHLADALEVSAARHNALGITERLPAAASPFHDRPFRVIWGGRFADAIRAVIEDTEVRAIAARRPIGNIDLFSDSTDLLCDTSRRVALRGLYTDG